MRTITPLEWAGWIAFHDIEPWGERQADLRAAYTVCAFAGGDNVKPAMLFPSLAGKPSAATFRSWAASRCPALQNPKVAQ